MKFISVDLWIQRFVLTDPPTVLDKTSNESVKR